METEGTSRYVIRHNPQQVLYLYTASEILPHGNVDLARAKTKEEAREIIKRQISKEKDEYYDAKGNKLDL